MAFEVKRIDPIDLQPRKGVGISLPFSGPGIFNTTFETKEAIKTNMINFFLTGTGERFLNPTFGSGLRNLLFDQLTEEKIDQIKTVIQEGLSTYFPRVITKKIELKADPDTNAVFFTMRYAISETSIEDTILINFET
jgi:phage baseplate assembly protein W|tara:strand:- start:1445 stop:1855 length:411 start_codon:yes stop_codon:yes gene_type:complete